MRKVRLIAIFVFAVVSTAFAQWTLTPCPTTNNLNAIHFGNSNIGYAVGDNFSTLKTVDQGNTWASITNTSSNNYLTSVYCLNSDSLIMGSGLSVYISINGGISWALVNVASAPYGGQVKSVCWVKPQRAFAAGYARAKQNQTTQWPVEDVAFSSAVMPFSTSWTASVSPLPTGVWPWGSRENDVFFVDQQVGYICGSNFMAKTTDGGSTWTSIGGSGNSIHFVNSNIGYLVGNNGVIKKTTTGGSTWFSQSSGTTQDLNSIYFSSLDSGCAVGNYGTILGTIDGGASWHLQYSPTMESYKSVFFTDNNNGYIVGTKGTILRNVTGPLGVPESNKSSDSFVFGPNPAREEIHFNASVNKGILSVYDMMGKEIKSHSFNSNSFRLSLAELPIGIYLLKMISVKGTVVRKVIKQ